jgi:hypothetical protein
MREAIFVRLWTEFFEISAPRSAIFSSWTLIVIVRTAIFNRREICIVFRLHLFGCEE